MLGTAGTVITSPSVDTDGATRLSRSQLRRTPTTVSATVAISTRMLAESPPTIDTMANWPRLRFDSMPNALATTEAMIARTNESTDESANDALTFWRIRVPFRIDTENVPVWMAVDRRLPRPPMTLPRSPIAAGTRVSSVG